MDLLGPVPVGPLAVSAAVVRPGGPCRCAGAELYDVARDRVVRRGPGVAVPGVDRTGPSATRRRSPHSPADGVDHDRAAGWRGGYLDAVEWRWIKGAVTEPGPGVVWMRPPRPGGGRADLARCSGCSPASTRRPGVSAALDPREWGS